LKKGEKSRIVVVSSLSSIIPYLPFRTGYAASKCALKGFFETLQAELIKSNIFVTTAYPGIVKTEINDTRLGKNPKGIDFSNAMSTEECAKTIVDGTIKAHREIVFTNAGKFARILEGIFPDLLAYTTYNRAGKYINMENEKDQ